MKLLSFKFTTNPKTAHTSTYVRAEIKVQHGHLWWKTIEKMEIERYYYGKWYILKNDIPTVYLTGSLKDMVAVAELSVLRRLK